jgi:pyrroloquinoline quinone biosynthesis protein E
MCHAVDDPTISEKPFKLISELTYRCNLKCVYCHNPVDKSYFNAELSTEQWKAIISEASSIGVVINELTGGEPTLRRDLIELVDYSKREGLYTKINTNGSTITDRLARELSARGLDAAQVGFPSLNELSHQKVTEIGGLLTKRVNGVKNLRKYNIPVYLNVVLTRFNHLEVETIIHFAEENDVSEVVIQSAFLFGKAAKNIRDGNNILPTREQMAKVQNKLSEIVSNKPRVRIAFPNMFYYTGEPMPCSWNKEGAIVVTPNGMVTPCEPASSLFPEVKFESLNKGRGLSDIWNKSSALEMFENTDFLPKICKNCDILRTYRGGCRVVTYMLTGNRFLEDPTCALSEKRNLIEPYITYQNLVKPD